MKFNGTQKFLLILTSAFFGIVFIASLFIFTFVHPVAAGRAFWPVQIAAFITALILSLIISLRYKNLSKMNGGDKDFAYYFKRIWLTVVILVAASIIISELVGLIFNAFGIGIRYNMESLFLQGAVFKIPLLLIYLFVIYNTFSQQGEKDANRKAFNLHFKILVMALALLLLTPGAMSDSMHPPAVDDTGTGLQATNLQAAFTPNRNVYTGDIYGGFMVNPDFSIVLTALTILFGFAIQMAVAVLSYKRGKQTFIKNKLNPAEVETDEKC